MMFRLLWKACQPLGYNNSFSPSSFSKEEDGIIISAKGLSLPDFDSFRPRAPPMMVSPDFIRIYQERTIYCES